MSAIDLGSNFAEIENISPSVDDVAFISRDQCRNVSEMKIRKIRSGEERELWKFYYNTIHNVNIQDYDKDQIAAWAPDDFDAGSAIQKLREMDPFVGVLEGRIIGYADIQSDGYIDHFYCHHEFQGQGVGRALFAALEQEA